MGISYPSFRVCPYSPYSASKKLLRCRKKWRPTLLRWKTIWRKWKKWRVWAICRKCRDVHYLVEFSGDVYSVLTGHRVYDEKYFVRTKRLFQSAYLIHKLFVYMVIKVVNDELIAIMGNEHSKINIADRPPTIILMCGFNLPAVSTISTSLPECSACFRASFTIFCGLICPWRRYSQGT